MSHSITHGPAVQYYLNSDPRRINPFNLSSTDFVPTDDPSVDAAYLCGVKRGEINRFYATVTPGVKRNVLNVTIYDKHNDNVVLNLPVQARNRFSGVADYHAAAVELLRSVAASQGVEIRMDLATTDDDTKAILSDMHENAVDASLFREGVALAQQGCSAKDLWHDEQRRGWAMQMGVPMAFAGAA